MKAKDLLKLIPARVRITKDTYYEILWVDEFPSDKSQLGECRHEHKQILIKKEQSCTEAFKTFLHEVFHAISFEKPPINLTEKQVQYLEESIFRILKLNGILDKVLKHHNEI